MTPLVGNVDEARRKYKKHPKDSIVSEKYLNLLARIQTEVLKVYGQVKQKIEQWEQDFFLQNGQQVPELHDINRDPHITALYKKFHPARKLLAHWNITAHL